MKLRNTLLVLAGAILMCSCNDWLRVSANSTIADEQLFTTEKGFEDAVYGVYVKLGEAGLYGSQLSWRMMEELSQTNKQTSSHPDLKMWKYDYTAFTCVKDVFTGLYNAIANINNILNWLDKSTITPQLDSVIRGEMYGLRAYCHLDLMRLYAKGDLAHRLSSLANTPCLPYVTIFDAKTTEQHTYKQYIEFLKEDCKKALAYLIMDKWNGNMDDYYMRYLYDPAYASYLKDGFLSEGFNMYRSTRFNWYAANGLMARILAWEGTKEGFKEAEPYCMEALSQDWDYLQDVVNTSWSPSMPTGKTYSSNTCANSSMIWRLWTDQWNIQSRGGTIYNWFDGDGMYDGSGMTNTNIVCMDLAYANEVFELATCGASDKRYNYMLDPVVGTSGDTRMNYVKYQEWDGSNQRTVFYGNNMSMIRAFEMHYILAESALLQGDKEKACYWLNLVRNWCGIPSSWDLDPAELSVDDIDNEIFKEYRKMFICEGQLFYYYKRKGFKTIPNYSGEMTDMQYVLPLPDDEVTYGGRIQNNK